MVTAESTDPALSGYWPSPWPGEDGNPRRTQAPRPGTPSPAFGDLDGAGSLTVTRRDAMGCGMVVLRDPGEVYLQGATIGADSEAWVERIDTLSLHPITRSPRLDAGPWWPGGIAVHANGDLYITQGRYCHRLDHETLDPGWHRDVYITTFAGLYRISAGT